MKCKFLILLFASLSLILSVSNAFAEVSIMNDSEGNYIGIYLSFQEKNGSMIYWEPLRKKVPSYLMLNIEGDLLNDGKPSVAEHPFTKYPWVFWPRFNGNDWEIVYSHWIREYWSNPLPICKSESNILEVTVVFEPSGIPFVAFTIQAETTQIYLTALVNGCRLTPIRISDPVLNCSSPVFIFERDLSAIAFFTPSGVSIVNLYGIFDIDEGPDPIPY